MTKNQWTATIAVVVAAAAAYPASAWYLGKQIETAHMGLEQRIAAPDVLTDLGKHARHAPGKWRLYHGARILVERDLSNGVLEPRERTKFDIDDIELVQIVGRNPDEVWILDGRLRRRHRRCVRPTAGEQGAEHRHNAKDHQRRFPRSPGSS